MKKIIALATILTLCLAANADGYKYTAVEGDPMGVRIYTLSNGLKVYTSVNRETPRLQANVVVRTGSRNDPAETTGLAHYLEHLMFKGTELFGTTDAAKEKPYLDDIEARYEKYRQLTDPEERRKAYHEIDSVSQLAAQYNIPNEYDKLMSGIGSEGSNAYTSNDVTCYVENIPSNEIENWARIQADRFRNMVIRAFHTELEAVYEEYNISLTSDQEKAWIALSKHLYPTHPYGTQTTLGTQEHLKNPSIVNIKDYFNRYYVPNNIAITLAGDFDPDEAVAIIDKHFGSWQPSASLSRPEYEPQPELTAHVDTTVVGLEAQNVWLGWRFDAARSLQTDTLDVISDMLSNGNAGLFDLNLEQPMKVMGAGAFCDEGTDYSSFVIVGEPKAGQQLLEVRTLLLDEVEKLKRGDFSDDLLPSVIANKKLRYYKSLDNNRMRAEEMVGAFANGVDWRQAATRLERQARLTKEDIVNFAQKHFLDNYVCVYKVEGVDSTQKKIDKPAITPIPANRDSESAFVKEIGETEVAPIEPRFLDFATDLVDTTTTGGLPLLYKQNTQDGLFRLTFSFDFGTEDDLSMSYAADYLDYIGTRDKTVGQLKQEFYKLACNYSVNVGAYDTAITLDGLSENMAQALSLLVDLLQNAKADEESFGEYVGLIEKVREDAKKDQRTNSSVLYDYGLYGPYSHSSNNWSVEKLAQTDPQSLVDNLKKLFQMEQTVLYYGPLSQPGLDEALTVYPTPATLAAVPRGEEYAEVLSPAQTEVIIAPYEAKNIYMRMYHNENTPWTPEQAGLKAMFNEYFGSGMNTIVFQELRETRGLAYNASARYVATPRPGHPEHYYTHIISQNDKMMDCIRVFSEILDDMPQSEKAFSVAKQSLTKNLQSARTTKYGVLASYLRAKRQGIDYDLNRRIYEQLPSITLEDIVEFERENMAHKAYRIVILGDESDLDMESLSKIGTIRRVTTEEIFGF